MLYGCINIICITCHSQDFVDVLYDKSLEKNAVTTCYIRSGDKKRVFFHYSRKWIG